MHNKWKVWMARIKENDWVNDKITLYELYVILTNNLIEDNPVIHVRNENDKLEITLDLLYYNNDV